MRLLAVLVFFLEAAHGRRLFQRVPPGVPTAVTSSRMSRPPLLGARFNGRSLAEFIGEGAETHARAMLTPAPVPVPIPVMATVPHIRGPAGTFAGITGHSVRVWTDNARDSHNH